MPLAVNSQTSGSPIYGEDGSVQSYYAPLERRARQIAWAQRLPPLLVIYGQGGNPLQRDRTLQALRDPRAYQFLQALPDPREAGYSTISGDSLE